MQGFTKHEQIVGVILLTAFVTGAVVWLIRERRIPASVEGSAVRYQKLHKAISDIQAENSAKLRININRATEEELIALPGIGPVTARKIVEYRKIKRSFETLESLKEVKGIGDKTFEKIKPFIMIEKQ